MEMELIFFVNFLLISPRGENTADMTNYIPTPPRDPSQPHIMLLGDSSISFYTASGETGTED
jgi:hypothetical protein